MQTTLNALIVQYYKVDTETEKSSIKNQIHLQYYHASAAERSAVQEIMHPFLDEIEQEMIEKDSIARQAYEMLKRQKALKAVDGR